MSVGNNVTTPEGKWYIDTVILAFNRKNVLVGSNVTTPEGFFYIDTVILALKAKITVSI